MLHGWRIGGGRLAALSVLAAILLALPASAGATNVTFGANLQAHTANSTATCGYPPYYPGIYPLGSSCTFFSTATPTGNAAETQVVPLPDPAANGNQSGTITAVRIKTGPYQSGPAKLTVLRAHRLINGGEAACCVGQAESAQFTLTPNSIVNVVTDLPVASTYDAAQRIYTYDTLALTVLDGTTPIPADFSGGTNGYCSGGYFPYVQTGQERFTGEYDICGFLVLMQADLNITPPPPPPPPPPTTQTIAFPAEGRIAGRTARIPLECAGNAICEGILRLQNKALGQAAAAAATSLAAKARKTVTYGKSKFKIAANSRATIKVKLSRQGKKLVRHRKKVRVYANATLGSQVFSKKLKLKAR
jgi:hypothetical protein